MDEEVDDCMDDYGVSGSDDEDFFVVEFHDANESLIVWWVAFDTAFWAPEHVTDELVAARVAYEDDVVLSDVVQSDVTGCVCDGVCEGVVGHEVDCRSNERRFVISSAEDDECWLIVEAFEIVFLTRIRRTCVEYCNFEFVSLVVDLVVDEKDYCLGFCSRVIFFRSAPPNF